MAEKTDSMRIIVTGSRTWWETSTVYKAISTAVRHYYFGYEDEVSREQLSKVYPNVSIVHGGAKGADSIAHDFAVKNNMKTEVFLADWNAHGRSAGPIRNSDMVMSNPKADVCLAFISDDESRGTFAVVHKAERRGIPVLRIPPVSG